MKKKHVARILLMILIIAIGAGIWGLVILLQGPESVIKDNTYIHRRIHFEFRIPAGWIAKEMTDKDSAEIILRKYGSGKGTDASAYLPVVSMNFSKVVVSGRDPILFQMNEDIAGVKAESSFYKNMRIKIKDVLKSSRFSAEGRLSYEFTGLQLGREQITEKRYARKGERLVWFTLSDFEETFNNKVLEEILATLKFN